ncbi:MAG: helix-turn-helix transcriptional regulator [Gammaproteobacteria bacterium]
MAAIHTFGSRQQTLLKTLLHNRAGESVDELAHELGISRNATNQHLSSLTNLGLIENTLRPSHGGRPVKNYFLSPMGMELFPRHYAQFSILLVDWIRSNLDGPALNSCLRELGAQLARDYSERVGALNGLPQKISEVATIMRELGYETDVGVSDDGAIEIIANNCVFQQVAVECEQICEFDLSLMGTLLNAQIDHQESIARDGLCCRFGITPD